MTIKEIKKIKLRLKGDKKFYPLYKLIWEHLKNELIKYEKTRPKKVR